MSVINEYKDPMSGKVNHFAKGSIKFISIKPVKDGPDVVNGVKTTWIKVPGQPDKKIEATHSISFLLQDTDDDNNVIDPQSAGEWVSMGEKKLHPNHADKVQVKFDSGYKDILPGMVVSFPIKVSKSKDGSRTFANGTLSGKTFTIRDESKAGQPAPRQQQQQSSAPQGGSGTKIFGEITEIVGNIATVNDEKNGPGGVVLTDEQLAQVQVGGRLAAFVDLSTGNIINSFKAYGPAGQGGGSGKKGGSYDQVGVETGHSINGFKELASAGYKVKDPLETSKAIHRATVDMKAFVAERTGKPVDSNPVGASAGNAILVALATRFNAKSEVSEASILEQAKDVYVTLSEPLYEYISGLGKEVAQKPAQSAPEPQVGNGTVSAPPVDFDNEPPMDFDDDIPF